MTTEQHPITPPPELLQQWSNDWHRAKVKHVGCAEYVTTQAARWGADQQLNADFEWLYRRCLISGAEELRAAMRPKPPSLAEEALDSLDRLRSEAWCEEIDFDLGPIRRALERLQELEGND